MRMVAVPTISLGRNQLIVSTSSSPRVIFSRKSPSMDANQNATTSPISTPSHQTVNYCEDQFNGSSDDESIILAADCQVNLTLFEQLTLRQKEKIENYELQCDQLQTKIDDSNAIIA